MSELPRTYQDFRARYSRVWSAYEALGAAAGECGPLDPRTRELIRLGMAAAAGSEGSVDSHTHRALEAGATPAEIEHALLLGVTTLGFPRTMAAWSWARKAIEARARG
jgi:AhpD family alkylhydroperoxidase